MHEWLTSGTIAQFAASPSFWCVLSDVLSNHVKPSVPTSRCRRTSVMHRHWVMCQNPLARHA